MTSATAVRPGGGPPNALARLLREPMLGPILAILVALVVFSSISDTFLTSNNLSLMLQQSVVVGIMAVGQTLIILTAGIDLSVGSIAVMGTIVMAQTAGPHGPIVALVATLLFCAVAGTVNGLLVTVLRLPPFIVTLGIFTVIQAATRLAAGSQTFQVDTGVLTALGNQVTLAGFVTTYGVLVMFAVYALVWYALTQTAWGRHVFAVGGNPDAARLTGIKTQRVLFSVYVIAGIVCAVAAWAALGRIPNADPNAYQNANLETITAVVIGGTSLFGGRGSVVGTLLGMLLVAVLRNGLTQAGVDSLYQNIGTGVLVIVAVAVDQFVRRRSM